MTIPTASDTRSADRELQELGERVRRLRDERTWSRERLSEASGLHPTFVGAIERGERNPTLRTLHKLARGLGMDIACLVADVGNGRRPVGGCADDDRVRVVVATEHEGIATVLSALEHHPRHEHIGGLPSVVGAKHAVRDTKPDVVIVEVSTAAAVEHVKGIARVAPTIVLSSLPPEEALLPCVAAGARGFLHAPSEPAVIDEAVALVARGGTCLDSFSIGGSAAGADRHFARNGRQDNARVESLSERQREILLLVGEGFTNDEIARVIGTSANTVKTHLRRAMRKLGARSRAEAVAVAIANG